MTLNRTIFHSLALGAAVAAAATPFAAAQRGGPDWTTTAGDPQRSAWVRYDPQVTATKMTKPGFQFLWKLKMDGTGKDIQRLTNFNDYEGWKASNPVISTDGKYMAFQIAHTADVAGVGYGLVLHKF